MRNISLDLLKIIECISVVVLHVIGVKEGILNNTIYYLAGCAVPIFFMVNGNLLFYYGIY